MVCKECNWWTLLDEIKNRFETNIKDEEGAIIQAIKYHTKIGNNKVSRFTGRTLAIEKIMSVLAHSANQVCKGHIEGKG